MAQIRKVRPNRCIIQAVSRWRAVGWPRAWQRCAAPLQTRPKTGRSRLLRVARRCGGDCGKASCQSCSGSARHASPATARSCSGFGMGRRVAIAFAQARDPQAGQDGLGCGILREGIPLRSAGHLPCGLAYRALAPPRQTGGCAVTSKPRFLEDTSSSLDRTKDGRRRARRCAGSGGLAASPSRPRAPRSERNWPRRPVASAPAHRSMPVSLAGSWLIHRARSLIECPRRNASVRITDSATERLAIPPQARSKRPSLDRFISGGHGE